MTLPVGSRGQLRVYDLDRVAPILLALAGEVHRRQLAAAQLVLEGIPFGQLSMNDLVWVAHLADRKCTDLREDRSARAGG